MIGVRHTATAFLFLCCGAIVLSTVTMQANVRLVLLLNYLAGGACTQMIPDVPCMARQ